MHVQINKERNSPEIVTKICPTDKRDSGSLSSEVKVLFFFFSFCHTTEEAAFKLGRCRYCKSMSTFTINMSLFFVLSFTAMYSEDVLGISSALMSFKHIENDFLYSHIHIYNIYFFYNTNSQLQ